MNIRDWQEKIKDELEIFCEELEYISDMEDGDDRQTIYKDDAEFFKEFIKWRENAFK